MTLRRTAPRKKPRWMFLVLAVGALLVVGSVTSVLAAPGDVSLAAGFEGNDGNLAPGDDPNGTDPGPTPNFDWNSFAPVDWEGDAPQRDAHDSASGWDFTGLEDWQVTTSDSAFAGGTKQDNECPTVNTGKAPNKDDLKRVYVASTTGGDGHTYLALGWARIPQNTTSPSAHVAFEFNQGDTPCGTGSDDLVERTEGDMLIVYDFEGGATDLPSIKLSLWLTDNGTNTATQCEVAKALPCWGDTQNLTALGFAEGRVNTFGSVTDELAPPAEPDEASVSESLGTNEFGEAIIDLTGAGVFEAGECAAFGLAYAVSRSSGNSAQAQMKDLVGPGEIDLQNCGSVIIRKETVPSPDPLDSTFSFTTTGGLEDEVGDADAFDLKDGDYQDYGTEVPAGAYSVSETDPAPNYVLTDIDCSASDTTNGSTIMIGADSDFDEGDLTVSFSLVGEDSIDCTFTNTLQTGAIQVTKTRKFASATEGDPLEQPHAGVTFEVYDDEDNLVDSGSTDADGIVCFDGLLFGDYTVIETEPAGYEADDDTQEVTVNNAASCDDEEYGGETLIFENTPLTDVSIDVTSQDPGATKSTIECVDSSDESVGSVSTPVDPASLDIEDLLPGTYTCTIVIDP